MSKYIIRRVLLLIPVLLGVSFIIFSMMHFTPGDAALTILGENATGEALEALREQMGLNDPFIVQYGRYIGNIIFHGDFGRSYLTNRQVLGEILVRFPNTLKLAFWSILLAAAIGIPIGILSSTKPNSIFDNISMVGSLIGVSMPTFWQALLMMLFFSLFLRWLPPSGFSTWRHMLMPVIVLSTSSAGTIARITRSSMLDVYGQDYIRTARSKGLNERKVIYLHAFRNAAIPVMTMIGLQFGYLLGGAVLTESIFSIPGVGRLMVDAIRQRDIFMVQGAVLFVAIVFSVVNLIVDVLYAYVDPRVRSQYK